MSNVTFLIALLLFVFGWFIMIGGLILTLSYEIPKRIPNCDFIAVVGVYTVPFTGYMRCFTVSRKRDLKKPEAGK